MDDKIDTTAMLMSGDTRLLQELVRQHEAARPKLYGYDSLCNAVIEVVAVGLCAYTTELGKSPEVMRQKYQNDPIFRGTVKSIAAELMRAFDRYEP